MLPKSKINIMHNYDKFESVKLLWKLNVFCTNDSYAWPFTNLVCWQEVLLIFHLFLLLMMKELLVYQECHYFYYFFLFVKLQIIVGRYLLLSFLLTTKNDTQTKHVYNTCWTIWTFSTSWAICILNFSATWTFSTSWTSWSDKPYHKTWYK